MFVREGRTMWASLNHELLVSLALIYIVYHMTNTINQANEKFMANKLVQCWYFLQNSQDITLGACEMECGNVGHSVDAPSAPKAKRV